MKKKLTQNVIKGILQLWEKGDVAKFNSTMRNRHIPRWVWQPIIEKDYEAVRQLLYELDPDPIEDVVYQDKVVLVDRGEQGRMGRVSPEFLNDE